MTKLPPKLSPKCRDRRVLTEALADVTTPVGGPLRSGAQSSTAL